MAFVSLTEIKAHLHIETDDTDIDDTYLTSLGESASEMLPVFLNRPLYATQAEIDALSSPLGTEIVVNSSMKQAILQVVAVMFEYRSEAVDLNHVLQTFVGQYRYAPMRTV